MGRIMLSMKSISVFESPYILYSFHLSKSDHKSAEEPTNTLDAAHLELSSAEKLNDGKT